MKPLPLVGGFYEAASVPADNQRCMNLLIEQDKEGGVPSVLYGIGQLVTQYTLSGPVRGQDVMNNRAFFVAGSNLYETTSGTPVVIGALTTSMGAVGICNNDTTLLIVDGVFGYTYDGMTFARINDPDFANGVTQCAWEGQYFVVGVDGSKSFYVSTLGSASAWDGLDFASAENKPELLRALIVLHDRLFLFSDTGTEQWVNTGNGEFAFERDNGSSIEVGIEAPRTLQSMNNGLYWIGRDKEGGGVVYELQGGTPQRISTHALEQLLQSVDRSDAYALTYQQLGHSFYCLTIPQLERTFVYDAAVQKWAERGQYVGDGYLRWQPNGHIYNGRHLFGDYGSGNVYALDTTLPSDRWMRTLPPMRVNQGRSFLRMLELDMEVGISPLGEDSEVMLRYSNDGGKTFKSPRMKSIGPFGMTRARVRFPRCGMARDWVLEISGTGNYRPALFGLYADMEAVP